MDSETDAKSLGTDYPKQQERCRRLLEQYAAIATLPQVNVSFAVASIKAVLREADEAAISGDVVRQVRAYAAMKECE